MNSLSPLYNNNKRLFHRDRILILPYKLCYQLYYTSVRATKTYINIVLYEWITSNINVSENVFYKPRMVGINAAKFSMLATS